MKRLLIALMIFLTMSILSAQTGLTTTISRTANIRNAPDADATLNGVARAGTTIQLDGRNDNGNWVRGITSNGLIGWVSSGTVNISLGDINGLPILSDNAPFLLSAPAQGSGTSSNSTATTSNGGYDPNGTTATATADVNLRSGPNTDYRRVGGLFNGESFTIDGRDTTGNWVRGINQRGVVGWVSASFISLSYDEVIALSAVSVDAPFSLYAPGGSASPATTSASEPLPAPIISTNAVTGFSYGGHVQGFSQQTIDAMNRSGMTWVKKQYRYNDGDNPASAAGMINDAHNAGFRILLGIVGANASQMNNPGYYDRFAEFTGGVAGLGADAIEVWNEPNIDHAWPAGQISPQSYTDLLARSYNAIKAANPNTMVVSAAPAPTGFFGGCSGAGCNDDLFVAGMAGAGAANYMDCIGIHYNEGILAPTETSGDPRGNGGHYTRYFRSMMDVYSNAFGGRKPLCFTELGYLTGEGYGALPPAFGWAGDVSVQEHATWLAQAVSLAASSGRVRLLIIWNVDFTHYGDDPMAGYAMIRPGGSCPACDALGN